MKRYAAGFVVVLLGIACGAAGGATPEGSGGTTGAGGSSTSKGGAAGKGGGAAAGGANGGTSAGGSPQGTGGSFVGPGGANGTGGMPDDGGGLQDALPDVGDSGTCVDGGGKGPGPLPHNCSPPTINECDAKTDSNPAIPNGMFGNGYDDDCDGVVDEGCTCDPDHAPGTTKDCWLLPASQADATTKEPVGWCKENSHGTIACVQTGASELSGRAWDGYCKGAQPPFADDACAPGDFDCDGKQENPKNDDCSCMPVVVTCPTEAVVISPYPYTTDLEKKKPNPYDPNPTQPFIVDGATWVGGGLGSKATGWKWTITGGDCDNILPHTTFGVYTGKDTTTAKRVGAEVANLGSNKKQKGLVVGPANDAHQIWPAFSLSGDYVVEGEFDLEGQHYACTMKVKVRAPGLRAEMCWDMGASATPGIGVTSTDLDLHLSRLQGSNCSGKHGWFDSCGKAPSSDDCFYQCDSGCRTGNQGFCLGLNAPQPGWGYPGSTNDACHGWGSLREPQQSCDNPRLDRDNLGCNTNIVDANANGGFQNPLADFCGPENINLDVPNAGDKFLVGVHYYGGDAVTHPHVNIYCNGERKLSLGYDPTTSPPVTYPQLSKSFSPMQMGGPQYYNGDMWEVARITWKGDANDPCLLEPVPSKAPKADKDGTSSYCVDTNQQNKANATDSDRWLFSPGGNVPSTAADACWH